MVTNRVIVHLVHGTWGRGLLFKRRPKIARWFEPRSGFRQQVQSLIGSDNLEFRPLLWSGRNSIFSRNIAAKKLASRIDRISREVPHARQFVIAHSHGGNIAMRAQALRQCERPEVSIITMATPFLKIFEIPGGTGELQAYHNLASVLTLVFLGSSFGLSSTLLGGLSILTGIVSTLISTIASVIFFLLLISLIGAVFDPYVVLADRMGPHPVTPRQNRAARLASLSSFRPGHKNATSVLVVRGPGDEANIALIMGYLISYLLSFVSRVMLSYAYYGLIGISLLINLLFSVYDVQEIRNGGLHYLMLSLVMITAAVIFLPPFFLLVGNLAKGAMGIELAIGCARCDISIDSTPDTQNKLSVLTIDGDRYQSGYVRHFIHEQNKCREAIGGWINHQLTGTSWDQARYDHEIDDWRYRNTDADGNIRRSTS